MKTLNNYICHNLEENTKVFSSPNVAMRKSTNLFEKEKKYRRALDDHAQILSMEITTEDEQVEEEEEGWEEKEKENKTKPFPSL